MNRRGFLLAEETLKIIIGVIAIGFLVYLLVSVYLSSNGSKELEQAKETLPFILNEAKAGKTSVDVYNPKYWWILSSDQELCICKITLYSSCKNEGICEKSNFTMQSPIQINNPPITLKIDQTNKILSK